jgi:hypothetical protein
MFNIVLAPHPDDEIIGCYSVWDQIDLVLYVQQDYRAKQLSSRPDAMRPMYRSITLAEIEGIVTTGTLYIPSQYDYHPLHREVRARAIGLSCKKMFYSVEMNVPWLEEEENPKKKRSLFERMYPEEVDTISKSDKYFLFKSIKPFDEMMWASVKFVRPMIHCWPGAPEQVSHLKNPHRHLFHFQVDVQQYGDDRDVEYLMLSDRVQEWFDAQEWALYTSCEMFARRIKWWLESLFHNPVRKVRVSVYEDGENGTVLE